MAIYAFTNYMRGLLRSVVITVPTRYALIDALPAHCRASSCFTSSSLPECLLATTPEWEGRLPSELNVRRGGGQKKKEQPTPSPSSAAEGEKRKEKKKRLPAISQISQAGVCSFMVEDGRGVLVCVTTVVAVVGWEKDSIQGANQI